MKRILLSLLILSATGALAFGVSRAFFSDTETSTGNTFTAGAIDLKVDNTSYLNSGVDGVMVSVPSLTWTATDLVNELFFNFADIKPGDLGEDTVSLLVTSNPAWVCADIDVTANDDVTCTEPELDDEPGCTAPGTGLGELADQLSCRYGHVHVLHRPHKEGLGPAYLAGFTWALQRNYSLIIEMDCDFSHAPWDLPRLVHRSHTADLVIGSRYVPGGGTENWNARRRFVSRCGNTYVSLFLGSTIHDWTGGFRCYRRELLARMNLATVRAKGYIFQVELAWRAVQLGADVDELPIRFCDRIEGQSKLGWQSIAEALMEVPQMYLFGLGSR